MWSTVTSLANIRWHREKSDTRVKNRERDLLAEKVALGTTTLSIMTLSIMAEICYAECYI